MDSSHLERMLEEEGKKKVDLNIFTITSMCYIVLKHCSTESDTVQQIC